MNQETPPVDDLIDAIAEIWFHEPRKALDIISALEGAWAAYAVLRLKKRLTASDGEVLETSLLLRTIRR